MYDKVTKINTIAKRKAYSKVNQGVLVEYVNAYRPTADINRNHGAQMTVVMTRNGRLRRDVPHGCGALVTNFATRSSTRGR